jgi:hypothetical protein
MAKLEQVVSSLQKLYAQRSLLDKQIIAAEKKFVTEAKAAIKATTSKAPAKKPAAKKPAPKPAAKPLLKK